MIDVTIEDGRIFLRFPYNELDVEKAKKLPDRTFLKRRKAWACKPILENFKYIREAWGSHARFSPEAVALELQAIEREKLRLATLKRKQGEIDLKALAGVPFKMPPKEHQKKALLLARDLPVFAYIMDQGTGKTKTTIDDAAHQFRKGRIEALLVIAPNSVKDNWVSFGEVDQISTHMAPDIPYVKGAWFSVHKGSSAKAWKQFEIEVVKQANDSTKLVVLSVNIEALTVQRLHTFLKRFVKAFKTMIVIDESTRIKNHSIQRTKIAMDIRKDCPVARILSGTPIIKSPLNAYSQFAFLDPDILGFGSYYSFRNRYCVMGGYEGKQVLFYKNLDELQQKIAAVSFRVTKDECLDLPPRVYERRTVEMTKDQAEAYKKMREECLVILEDKEVKAPIVLTQLLRLQQITSGIITHPDGKIEVIPAKRNPKFQEVLEILEERGDQKVVIWSRFREDLAALAELLRKEKIGFVEFHGGIDAQQRVKNRLAFQNDPKVEVFLGNPQAGGIGIDLYAGSIVIYVANSFSTEERIQSEDRCHRIGTTRSVTYYDIVCQGTVDMKILATLRSNKNISDAVLSDPIREWI